MMDFVWKQPPREDDVDNQLRCVFAAPTASSILDSSRSGSASRRSSRSSVSPRPSAPILSPYGEDRPAGAAGLQVADWFDIRLVDPETDREVPVGEVGELVVRPRHPWTCTMGYYGMPEKTVEAWRNLWFHTGDALRKGRGRAGTTSSTATRTRCGGVARTSAPTRSSRRLLGHPAVVECAVLGVPADVEAGEDEVMAVIVVTSRSRRRRRRSGPGARGEIPAFAIPRFIRFVDALPKTPSEKVQKARPARGRHHRGHLRPSTLSAR